MEILRDKGVEISYSDPHVPNFPLMREHRFDLESVDLSNLNNLDYDAAILTTAHNQFDYQTVINNIELVIDCQNKLSNEVNIVRA